MYLQSAKYPLANSEQKDISYMATLMVLDLAWVSAINNLMPIKLVVLFNVCFNVCYSLMYL